MKYYSIYLLFFVLFKFNFLYVCAVCTQIALTSKIEIVVAQIITGPPELVDAISTPESLRTYNQTVLVVNKQDELRSLVSYSFHVSCENQRVFLRIFSSWKSYCLVFVLQMSHLKYWRIIRYISFLSGQTSESIVNKLACFSLIR
jgi:hypothetical protein